LAVETVSLTEKNQSPIGLMALIETLDWSGMVKRLWEHSTCSEIALFMQCQSPPPPEKYSLFSKRSKGLEQFSA